MSSVRIRVRGSTGVVVGNDQIYGAGRPETIRAEGGEDLIMAGRGSDSLYGEEDDDEILAGSGDDLVDGGGGVTRCWGNLVPTSFAVAVVMTSCREEQPRTKYRGVSAPTP